MNGRTLALALLFAAGPAFAGQSKAPDGDGSAASACTDVAVGSARSYGCLNRAFARTAQQTQATPVPQGLDATSPPSAVGTFDQDAVREHLGANFGHSVTPPPQGPR